MANTMSWDDWTAQDAVGLAEMVRERQVTPNELAEQAAAAVELVNPALAAVIEIFDDKVADPFGEGLNPDGAFAGVPFLMKDLGPTMKGRLQEMGSLLARWNRARADTFLTAKMRAAGLNLVGRTTTPELGLCGSAENPDIYITRNPWDLAYTAGGSSSGAGAAVAAGVLPLLHSTDGGGSIRVPASMNGNIGLKPSRGVFSLAPALSDLSGLVSTQGCQSRTVRDTAAFVDHCRGGAPGEFMPYWSPDEPYLQAIKRDPEPLMIAASYEWGDYRCSPEIVDQLTVAVERLTDLGHRVEWVTPDVDFQAAYSAQTTCYITNFAQAADALLKQFDLADQAAEVLEPMTVRVWQEGLSATYGDRVAMQHTFNQTSRDFGTFLDDWDIILTPTMAKRTPLIGTTEYLTMTEATNVRDWFENLWSLYAYTPLANLAGLPAITLPLARFDDGLPLGIQAQAGQAKDGLLLQLAAQIERSISGQWNQGRRPATHVTTAG